MRTHSRFSLQVGIDEAGVVESRVVEEFPPHIYKPPGYGISVHHGGLVSPEPLCRSSPGKLDPDSARSRSVFPLLSGGGMSAEGPHSLVCKKDGKNKKKQLHSRIPLFGFSDRAAGSFHGCRLQ